MKAYMKSFTAATLLILFLAMGIEASAKTKGSVVIIQTSAICESCKARLEKTLKATPGIMEAELNLTNKKVKVKYDPTKLSENQIRLVITQTGYDADDMKADAKAYEKLPHCCQKPEKGKE